MGHYHSITMKLADTDNAFIILFDRHLDEIRQNVKGSY